MQEDRDNSKENKENTDETLFSKDDLNLIENEMTAAEKETAIAEDDILDSVIIADDFYPEEDISASLKQQVKEELDLQGVKQNEAAVETKRLKSNKVRNRILITVGIILGVLILFSLFLVGTKTGRKLIYRFAGGYIYDQLDKDQTVPANSNLPADNTQTSGTQTGGNTAGNTQNTPGLRQENYVTNFLIFGIEEIEGASNTDSMMIASINTMDDTVKLTSLLRDTYIELPGEKPRKLNAIYAQGGAEKLVSAIEQSYHIKIDGYAHINFESFEKIIDRLGGISIELGQKEADYLNSTNYISDPANRNVHAGVNLLNGNQALGYARVRKVETLGGVNNDYGRSLRQRRVLSAIFDKYKSQSVFDLIPIMKDCLSYVFTDLSEAQIESSLEAIVENKITTMDTSRIPVDGMFTAYSDYNGVNDPLVIKWDDNIKELYKFIYLDSDSQAQAELNAMKQQ